MYGIIQLKKLVPWLAMLLVVCVPAGLYFSLDRVSAAETAEVPAAETAAAALETGAWGLSFQTPNQPPIADVSAEELLPYDAKYIGDTGKKTIYLTFDCGYENGYTETILDVLKAHEAKAAFFVVGNYITSCPELVRRMAQEGHIVGNHTWSHPDMSAISEKAAFAAQLQKNADAYRECVGQEMPRYYRPPQGVYSQENLAMAKELGYRTVFWSLAYVDWKTDDQPTEEAALEKLTERVHGGAVVLLHNTSKTNAAILDRLLTAWAEAGYEFGTLDELFGAEITD